jgi:hypothetical protein
MPEPKNIRGRFFAIDSRICERVYKLGMNAAVAYLVLACGTDGNNSLTEWSIHAIEKYTGISRARAGAAIEKLISGNIIRRVSSGDGRPIYEILPYGEKSPGEDVAIWLPNALVTGAANETPPVELVRQTQDVMTLRLLLDVYYSQDLVGESGVQRRYVWQKYERERIGQRGEYDVWAFGDPGEWVHWSGFTLCHRRNQGPEGERGTDFFQRMNSLVSLGLVEWIACLLESELEDAEIIHPLHHRSDVELERRLAWATQTAAEAMLSDGQRKRAEGLILAPVPRHLARVQLIGVARLRYRPETSRTAAWWGRLNQAGERYIIRYNELARRAGDAAATGT